MAVNDVIQYKLDKLITLMLTKGVSPSEIADNIFLKDYKEIKYRKDQDRVIGELVFTEIEDNKAVDITLRYIYTLDKRILKIEEEKLGKVLIQWDRENAEAELLNDIVDILRIYYTDTQFKKFLLSLPTDLAEKIKKEYYKVA